MIIGILTFYRVENFGANLQALSTYKYLEKVGHTPIMIYYTSLKDYIKIISKNNTQLVAHFNFVDRMMKRQTAICHNCEDINKEIEKFNIEAIIIGSDAVVQHHPLLARIHRGRRKPFIIANISKDRIFPNMFWGIGISTHVKIALMSVSSQNSRYSLFSYWVKKKMKKALSRFSYISVRDKWTQQMFNDITGSDYPYTPDPVFAFNYNIGDLIPSREYILKKFSLPEKYVLISLMSQSVSVKDLCKLNRLFKEKGFSCVSLPMPTGKGFKHDFDYSISEPLDSMDWYALIKYSSGYVGSNMHPIIVSLHNAIPCYSIDFWGTVNFWNKTINDGSSKVLDILSTYGLESNHKMIENDACDINPEYIVKHIIDYPIEKVRSISKDKYREYCIMMNLILKSFEV